jgi:hypothetical protein
VTPDDKQRAAQLDTRLKAFRRKRPLPGLDTIARRHCLVSQLIESIRRVRFISVIRSRAISLERTNPASDLFDPIRGAVVFATSGNLDEAYWLVFLAVHFGKVSRTGWQRVRDVYGALGASSHWTWDRTSTDVLAFRQWLKKSKSSLEGGGRRFGNHRKYESLDAFAPRGTGDVVATYVQWIAPPRTHQQLIAAALNDAKRDPKVAFDILYRSMRAVASFGRMARFDYLTMIAKLGLGGIEPRSTYLIGATGPLKAAEVLFGVKANKTLRRTTIEKWLSEMQVALDVGPQVLEDALCNWQKSPERFVRFRG